MRKRKILILFLLAMISTLGIILTISTKLNTTAPVSTPTPTPISAPESYNEKLEYTTLEVDEELTKDWKEFKNFGFSFKFPESWEIEETKDQNCNPYKKGESNCIHIKNKQSYIVLKVEKVSTNYDPGTGRLYTKDYFDSQIFQINAYKAIRPNFVNGTEEYFSKKNIELKFTEKLKPQLDSFGDEYLGSAALWLINENTGYTITYLIDPSQLNDEDNLNENQIIKTMDQIIASLEIDFSVNPFDEK